MIAFTRTELATSPRPSRPEPAPGPITGADDWIIEAYLDFLDACAEQDPDLIRPLTAAECYGLEELLEGVDVDLEADLGDDDYVLP